MLDTADGTSQNISIVTTAGILTIAEDSALDTDTVTLTGNEGIKISANLTGGNIDISTPETINGSGTIKGSRVEISAETIGLSERPKIVTGQSTFKLTLNQTANLIGEFRWDDNKNYPDDDTIEPGIEDKGLVNVYKTMGSRTYGLPEEAQITPPVVSSQTPTIETTITLLTSGQEMQQAPVVLDIGFGPGGASGPEIQQAPAPEITFGSPVGASGQEVGPSPPQTGGPSEPPKTDEPEEENKSTKPSIDSSPFGIFQVAASIASRYSPSNTYPYPLSSASVLCFIFSTNFVNCRLVTGYLSR